MQFFKIQVGFCCCKAINFPVFGLIKGYLPSSSQCDNVLIRLNKTWSGEGTSVRTLDMQVQPCLHETQNAGPLSLVCTLSSSRLQTAGLYSLFFASEMCTASSNWSREVSTKGSSSSSSRMWCHSSHLSTQVFSWVGKSSWETAISNSQQRKTAQSCLKTHIRLRGCDCQTPRTLGVRTRLRGSDVFFFRNTSAVGIKAGGAIRAKKLQAHPLLYAGVVHLASDGPSSCQGLGITSSALWAVAFRAGALRSCLLQSQTATSMPDISLEERKKKKQNSSSAQKVQKFEIEGGDWKEIVLFCRENIKKTHTDVESELRHTFKSRSHWSYCTATTIQNIS